MKISKLILPLNVLLLLLINVSGSMAQSCIHSTQYPSSTLTIANTGTNQVTTCSYAGEFSVNNFTAAGLYYFGGTGGAGNYLTVTDNANNPVGSGYSLVGVSIPSVGLYRVHVSTNPSCGTDGVCHTITISSGSACLNTTQYPSGTITIANSGTTTVSTCNYGGEYSVNNFPGTGAYTINATGGAGNYITVSNTAGTVIYAIGAPPVVFNAPSAGIYRIHLNTSAPGTCGTDATCHTVTVVGPGAPPAPPANDLCANATTMAVNTTTAGTTVLATTESPTPPACANTLNQPGVWYRVTGNGNILGAGTCPTTSWDSKIFIYSGSCGALTCLASNDDFGPLCSSAAASATWCSVQGVDYFILVTGYSSASAFSITVSQTVVTLPILVANATYSATCPGVANTLTVTGGTSYTWSTNQTGNSVSVAPTVNTTYTVSSLSTSGCGTGTTTVAISTTVTPPSVSAPDGTICAGDSYTATPTGAATYSYSGGNPVSPSGTTTYSVVGFNTVGCASPPAPYTVSVNPLPIISAVSSVSAICLGDSVIISASGASTYSWSTGAITSTISVSPATNSVYIVGGIDANGCGNFTSTAVTVNPLPNVNAVASSTYLCVGETTTVTASGAATYSWSNGSSLTATPVSPVVTTIYTVTGISSLNCENTATVAVTVNSLQLSTSSNTAVCQGGSVTLGASGVSTYTWVNQGNTANITVSPSVTTEYTLNASGDNCPFSAVVTVTVYNNPLVGATISQATICEGESAVLTASGAATYSWSQGGSGASITVNPGTANTYTFNVTGIDNNDCSASSSALTLVVDVCTGISKIDGGRNAMLVYPNPTTGQLNISVEGNLMRTISVMDVTGRILKQAFTNEENFSVDIREFTNGVYYVKMQESSNTEVIKVIKH